MKFSHSIQFNAVPDWSSQYINYSNLKKLCVGPSPPWEHVTRRKNGSEANMMALQNLQDISAREADPPTSRP